MHSSLKAAAALYLPLAGLLVWLGRQEAVPLRYLLKDPQAAMHVPFYVGLVSNLGVLFWATAAAVSLLAGFLLGPRGGMLRFAGFFTAWLTLDDLFMLHEEVFLFHLGGVPQPVWYAAYAVAGVFFLVRYRREILATEWVWLVLAGGLLAASIGMDLADSDELREDGAKLLGAATWCFYFVRTSFRALTAAEEAGGSDSEAR